MGGFRREGFASHVIADVVFLRQVGALSYSWETGKSIYYVFYTLKPDSVILHP